MLNYLPMNNLYRFAPLLSDDSPCAIRLEAAASCLKRMSSHILCLIFTLFQVELLRLAVKS